MTLVNGSRFVPASGTGKQLGPGAPAFRRGRAQLAGSLVCGKRIVQALLTLEAEPQPEPRRGQVRRELDRFSEGRLGIRESARIE